MGKLLNGLFGTTTLHACDRVYYLEVKHAAKPRESYQFERFI